MWLRSSVFVSFEMGKVVGFLLSFLVLIVPPSVYVGCMSWLQRLGCSTGQSRGKGQGKRGGRGAHELIGVAATVAVAVAVAISAQLQACVSCFCYLRVVIPVRFNCSFCCLLWPCVFCLCTVRLRFSLFASVAIAFLLSCGFALLRYARLWLRFARLWLRFARLSFHTTNT